MEDPNDSDPEDVSGVTISTAEQVRDSAYFAAATAVEIVSAASLAGAAAFRRAADAVERVEWCRHAEAVRDSAISAYQNHRAPPAPAEMRRRAFRNIHAADERIRMGREIRAAHPDRIPVILERRAGDSRGAVEPLKRRFLIPTEMTRGQFSFMVCAKYLEGGVLPTRSVWFSSETGVMLSPAGDTMGSFYQLHASREDGFLYLYVAEENTFG